VKYISTRGQAPSLSFEDVVLTGLASDGGLYVPESLPKFSQSEIASWAGLSYQELAFKVMHPFVSEALSDDELKQLIDKSYASFSLLRQAIFGFDPARKILGTFVMMMAQHGADEIALSMTNKVLSKLV
jgi:threonine synthase